MGTREGLKVFKTIKNCNHMDLLILDQSQEEDFASIANYLRKGF